MKTQTIYIISGALAVTGVGILIAAMLKGRKVEGDIPVGTTPPTMSPYMPGVKPDTRRFSCMFGNEFPLRFGSCGENVSKWQTYIKQNINPNIAVDGKFGAETEMLTRLQPNVESNSVFSQGMVAQQDFNFLTF